MFAVDTLDDLLSLLKTLNSISGRLQTQNGRMHCTTCGRVMKMLINANLPPPAKWVNTGPADRYTGIDKTTLAPALFTYSCVQCGTSWTAVIYAGPLGPALAVFPGTAGGLSTAHTPKPVAYYLDQAYKAQSASAHSAAIAMYRAAIEHLLFNQGYQVRELGPKIAAVERDIKTSAGPAWARQLDLGFLKVLKDLGNYSIHPNDGDISRQSVFDLSLLAQVQATVLELLEIVYEEPLRRAARLNALTTASEQLRDPAQ